jgi:adenylate kinase
LKVRLPDEILFKVLRLRLTENDCRNRGYVLDGFPKTYKQAQEVFLYKPKKLDENGDEIAEEEPELEEGEEKSWDGYVIRPEIFPKSVILLDAQDDASLMLRIKTYLPEAYAAGSHYNEAEMKRRIAAYRKANNSQVADAPLKLFFEQQAIQLHQETDSTRTPADQVLKSLKIYIERFEKPFNYMTFDE